MNKEEAEKALQSLADKGFLEKQEDGRYKPTPLGRIVAENSGTAS